MAGRGGGSARDLRLQLGVITAFELASGRGAGAAAPQAATASAVQPRPDPGAAPDAPSASDRLADADGDGLPMPSIVGPGEPVTVDRDVSDDDGLHRARSRR